ncbi:phenylacetate--CoA ligase family protein [Naumannella huperziae]
MTEPRTERGRRLALRALLGAQDLAMKQLVRNQGVHTALFARGLAPVRAELGRYRAWLAYDNAARRVPAYREFLAEQGIAPGAVDGEPPTLAGVPEMDKASYIKRWSVQERCLDGRLPTRGVVVDESSGSTGTPTSWVRGPAERNAVRTLLQIGFRGTTAAAEKPIFILNAFSLGAWATGMNISASLTDVAIIKSIGPDRDKIISTIREFGTGYTYLLLSYPPFLKELADDDRIDLSAHDVMAGFGGEGMSESMRDHLLGTFGAVVGSYGASDLEINLGIESDFTIALRRALLADPELAAAISRSEEYGVTPMIFQYNPYDYLLETNQAGELLVTITRPENISPRIRYNIHDRGHVATIRELAPVLRRLGHAALLDGLRTDLPVLFLYGRSDLSVDFNGAVVTPDEVRDVLNSHDDLIDAVHNHRLISYEDANADRRLQIALQLEEGRRADEETTAAWARDVFAALLERNGDLRQACRTAAPRIWPTLAAYEFRTGPFAADGRKLKNEYVWQLPADAVAAAGLVPGVAVTDV